jgi:hypothetical protein
LLDSPGKLNILVSTLQSRLQFTGRIFKVTADVSGKMIQDTEEEMRAIPSPLSGPRWSF